MKAELVKLIDKFERSFRAEGYQVTMTIKPPLLLIAIRLSPQDIEYLRNKGVRWTG